MKKRILSLVMALCLMVALLPASALAADVTTNVATADDLTAALNNSSVSSITFTADITMSASINVTRNLAIDGGNFTLTYTGSGADARAITVENTSADIDLDISNLTVDCTASYCQRGINFNSAEGTLDLDNVTVKGTNVTYALNLPGSAISTRVTIEDSSLTGNIALNVWGHSSIITVKDTELVSVDNNAEEDYSAIGLNSDGTTSAHHTVINITGGSITALDENGNDSQACRNSTDTGEINVSATTTVRGHSVVLPGYSALVLYAGSDQFYSCPSLQVAIVQAADDDTATVKMIAGNEENVNVGGRIFFDANSYAITGTFTLEEGASISSTHKLTVVSGVEGYGVSETITSGSFPYAYELVSLSNVEAAIGGICYATLADAIAAAQDGDTVTLLGDVETSAITLINKAITLDGAGYTLEYTGSGSSARAINVNCAGIVAIQNLTIDCADAERAINIIQEGVSLTIDTVIIPYAKYAVNVAASSEGSNIDINNSDITGYAALNITGSNTEVHITASTLTGENNYDNPEENSFGAIAVGDFTAPASTSNVMISATEGTTINATQNGEAYETIIALSDGAGYFVVLDAELNYSSAILSVHETCDFATGVEVFALRDDYSEQMNAAGYLTAAVEDAEVEGLVFVIKTPVSIGETPYNTLAEAVAAVKSGETIKLWADNSETGIKVGRQVNFTVDANGFAFDSSAIVADTFYTASASSAGFGSDVVNFTVRFTPPEINPVAPSTPSEPEPEDPVDPVDPVDPPVDPEDPEDPVEPEDPKPELPEVSEETMEKVEAYEDVDLEEWYAPAVLTVVESGLFEGYSEDEFAPDEDMTRAMMWTVLARLDGKVLNEEGEVWYADARQWAINEGISDGEGADDSVTREQIVTMLWRYVGSPETEADLSGYTDAANVSDWAEAAVKWAVANKIMEGDGDGTFRPTDTATRAEVAQFMLNYQNFAAEK